MSFAAAENRDRVSAPRERCREPRRVRLRARSALGRESVADEQDLHGVEPANIHEGAVREVLELAFTR
jgi:hypothetical protein